MDDFVIVLLYSGGNSSKKKGEFAGVQKAEKRSKGTFYKCFACGTLFMLLGGAGFIFQSGFFELFAENKTAEAKLKDFAWKTEKQVSTFKVEGAEQKAAARNSELASYTLKNGRITPRTDSLQAQEPVEAGNDESGTVVLTVDEGAVVVTVNNINKSACTARVEAVAAANAVLTEAEREQASDGDIVEIRIDVERMEDVPDKDRKTILKGMEIYRKKVLGLTMGIYVDISVFKRIGGEEWSAVHKTGELLEIILDTPQELQELATDFYVIRAHEGENLLLKDMDDRQESITIESDCFSVCAVTYKMKKTGTGGKCELCHMCPAFLGVCCFVWLALLVAALVILLILMYNLEKRAAEEEKEEEDAEDIYRSEWDL